MFPVRAMLNLFSNFVLLPARTHGNAHTKRVCGYCTRLWLGLHGTLQRHRTPCCLPLCRRYHPPTGCTVLSYAMLLWLTILSSTELCHATMAYEPATSCPVLSYGMVVWQASSS
eukprot:2946783-Rhodomonas_salina.1